MENKQNRIELKLNQTLDILTGNPYGVEVFNEQVKDKLIPGEVCTIVFPAFLNYVSSSFVQGFCSYLFDKFGRNNIYEILKFECDNKEVEEQIKEAIEFLW